MIRALAHNHLADHPVGNRLLRLPPATGLSGGPHFNPPGLPDLLGGFYISGGELPADRGGAAFRLVGGDEAVAPPIHSRSVRRHFL